LPFSGLFQNLSGYLHLSSLISLVCQIIKVVLYRRLSCWIPGRRCSRFRTKESASNPRYRTLLTLLTHVLVDSFESHRKVRYYILPCRIRNCENFNRWIFRLFVPPVCILRLVLVSNYKTPMYSKNLKKGLYGRIP